MSQNNSNNCNVRILDKEYSINCSDNEKEMLLKSAHVLNEKIKETRSGGNIAGGERIMVMTALNIVYELLQSQTQQVHDTETEKRLKKINTKMAKMLTIHQQIELT
ncbi:MAG: cell division protein ZapA [Gammaproteobacteria bacterium]|nr:cell division protein ZapA [Gammaproteobacteria bacterium]